MNLPRRRFSRAIAVGLIAVIFVLGITVGVLGTHLYYAHRLRQPGSVSDILVNAAALRVTKHLDLRPQQVRQLDAILDDTRGEMKSLRRDLIDRLRAIRARGIDRLFGILDDEQRRKLERLHATEGQVLDDYLSPPDSTSPRDADAESPSP